ncbi:hypothetical protein GDO81_022251 [Engystomops pustulosus]|uniref:Uncharacterized protein n=1 Tax=Engystomops pustulosus TaxID=76066 RepID=A0AAV6YPS8_ENGPU|nr:hypothetical protein GDO81_022251 [Engystomops pustulosus]
MADLPTQVTFYHSTYFGHVTNPTAPKALPWLPWVEADTFLSPYKEGVGEVQGDIVILAQFYQHLPPSSPDTVSVPVLSEVRQQITMAPEPHYNILRGNRLIPEYYINYHSTWSGYGDKCKLIPAVLVPKPG